MSAPLLVGDSGPLIALARLDLLAIPSRLFGELLVTTTVWQEVLRGQREVEHARLSAAWEGGLLRVVDAPEQLPLALAEARLLTTVNARPWLWPCCCTWQWCWSMNAAAAPVPLRWVCA